MREVVKADPFGEPPSYESLVGNLAGLYSRRINLQHRFVYQVLPEEHEKSGMRYQGVVKVARTWTQYDGAR